MAEMIRTRLDGENDVLARSVEKYGATDNVSRSFAGNVGGVQLLACDLIDHLRRDNPRFDAEKFAEAAGIGHLIDVNPSWRRA